jgi:hypothetical protein
MSLERAFVVVTSLVALTVACACEKPKKQANLDNDPGARALHELELKEDALRKNTDWATFPSSDTTLGPDPIDVVALPDQKHFAAVLRGVDALVVLDENGKEVAREKAPHGARSIAVDEKSDGTDASTKGVWLAVVGDLSSDVALYTFDGAKLTHANDVHAIAAASAGGLRSVAFGRHHTLDVVDVDGKLHALAYASADATHAELGAPVDVGLAPLALKRAGTWLVGGSALAHRVVAVPIKEDGALDDKNAIHVDNDGPFWGFDARIDASGALLIAAGHVEDHPLDRSGGSFGYIDSFVRVVKIDASGAHLLREVNASEHAVVIPKALAFVDDETLLAIGSGSGKALQLNIASGEIDDTIRALPGIVAVAVAGNKVLGADPLLDAFVALDAEPRPIFVEPRDTKRGVDSKVGEALVFTTIMAPRQKSDAQLSRFTCEACHFEGGGDGRIHDTSRKNDDGHAILATTKPLLGLFNNKPLFTRAMDENLTQMAHAEFRVANANSTLDPWFALTLADAPWLSFLGVTSTLQPPDLRRSLVAFLHDFTPRSNPHVIAKGPDATARKFDDVERHGAEVFRDRCASCHAPKLVGDDVSTAQSFKSWERFVLSDNEPLTWSGDAKRVKTGIEPYVHAEGARPSSLRRISFKHPYFTNGTSTTLDDVVAKFRFTTNAAADEFFHNAPSTRTDLASITPDDQRALVAFLRLL